MTGVGRVAALGRQVSVQGFALAGVLVLPVEDDADVRAAWDGLPDDVAVVVLTVAAAEALGTERTSVLHPLAVVLPP